MSLDQLNQTIAEDARKKQDRIVAVYGEDEGWRFGCDEHKNASGQVQACLNDHEAIAFRPRNPGGRSSHEFPAMVAQLGKKLGADGGGASSVIDLDVVASDAAGFMMSTTVAGDTAEEVAGSRTQKGVGAKDTKDHDLQELLEALAAKDAELVAKDAKLAANRSELVAKDAELAANRAELTAKDAELADLRARVPSEGEPPV